MLSSEAIVASLYLRVKPLLELVADGALGNAEKNPNSRVMVMAAPGAVKAMHESVTSH